MPNGWNQSPSNNKSDMAQVPFSSVMIQKYNARTIRLSDTTEILKLPTQCVCHQNIRFTLCAYNVCISDDRGRKTYMTTLEMRADTILTMVMEGRFTQIVDISPEMSLCLSSYLVSRFHQLIFTAALQNMTLNC